MTDPDRLLDDPAASPLGRALLASAGADAPSSTSRAAAARRLGVAVVVVSGTAGTTAAAAGSLWWKLGLVALVFGGAVALHPQSSAPVTVPPAPSAASAEIPMPPARPTATQVFEAPPPPPA